MLFLTLAGASFLLNMVLIPLLLHIAHRKSWYDEADHRKIHTGNIPRIGGIGIGLSFFIILAITYLFFRDIFRIEYEKLIQFIPFFTGLIFIHVIGILDDFTDLSAKVKLIVQIVVSLAVVASGHYFQEITFPFVNFILPLSFFGPIITLLWIVGVTNAINLLDGLDGLSSGTSGIAVFFMGLSAVALNNPFGAVLSFILAGSILGFLVFNFPPAKLFMGDSGSLFLGYILACLPIFVFTEPASEMALPLAITFLLIPILDTIAAILRRKRKGLPFHTPDKEHLHHKLLDFGFSNINILHIVYGKTFILSISAYLWIKTRTRLSLIILFFFWITTILLFIILDRKNRRRLEQIEQEEQE
jgi:UDP-GlcNAc:undecaprenyl-phosphate/decaprenyl-phosphate GlcNAc-1-phosphate transferase